LFTSIVSEGLACLLDLSNQGILELFNLSLDLFSEFGTLALLKFGESECAISEFLGMNTRNVIVYGQALCVVGLA
jgi:hypothetical protein